MLFFSPLTHVQWTEGTMKDRQRCLFRERGGMLKVVLFLPVTFEGNYLHFDILHWDEPDQASLMPFMNAVWSLIQYVLPLIYKWLSILIDKSLQKLYALVRMDASFTSKPFFFFFLSFDKIKELLFTSDHMCVCTEGLVAQEVLSWSDFKAVMSRVLLETCEALSLSPGCRATLHRFRLNTQKWEEQETISMLMGQIPTAPPSITCTNIIKPQSALTKYNFHLHRRWSIPLNYA